jgi:hypothetical protein
MRAELSVSSIVCVFDFRCVCRADIIKARVIARTHAEPTKGVTLHQSLIAE